MNFNNNNNSNLSFRMKSEFARLHYFGRIAVEKKYFENQRPRGI